MVNNVRSLRESARMTQAQLAAALNICQQAVAKWEAGRGDPKWEMAPKLAATLNCKIDELFVSSQ